MCELIKWHRSSETSHTVGMYKQVAVQCLTTMFCIQQAPIAIPWLSTALGNDELIPNISHISYLTQYISYTLIRRRDSVVGIGVGYGLDDRGVGVRVPVGSRFFSSCRPDRLWGPPNLLSNGYRGLFSRGQNGQGVKLTTHLQLVPRSSKYVSIHPLLHTPSWRSA
jgi:hypothetical protein